MPIEVFGMRQKKRILWVIAKNITIAILIFALMGWLSNISGRRWTLPPYSQQVMEAALQFLHVDRIAIKYDNNVIEINKHTNPEEFDVIRYTINPLNRLSTQIFEIHLEHEVMEIIFYIDDNRLVSANIYPIAHIFRHHLNEHNFRHGFLFGNYGNAIWNNTALIFIDNNPRVIGTLTNRQLSKDEILAMFLDFGK